jgi:ATP-dependent DNA helicase RecQ
LAELHGHRIIEYLPQKEEPQICFLRIRVKMQDLSIDMHTFNARRQKFEERVKAMIAYLDESNQCRSRSIGLYFGDTAMKDCGICDNCLKRKSLQLTSDEFSAINNRILDSIRSESMQTKELLQRLKGISEVKLWKVINFLQSENKIGLDKGGRLHVK